MIDLSEFFGESSPLKHHLHQVFADVVHITLNAANHHLRHCARVGLLRIEGGGPEGFGAQRRTAPGRAHQRKVNPRLRELLAHDLVLDEIEGDITPADNTCIGAWAKVYFKNRSHPMHKRVKLSTFNKGFGRWSEDADERILAGDLSGLTSEASFDSHPPLGKWVIATGEAVERLLGEVQLTGRGEDLGAGDGDTGVGRILGDLRELGH